MRTVVPAFGKRDNSMFMRKWLVMIGGITVVQLAPNVMNSGGANRITSVINR